MIEVSRKVGKMEYDGLVSDLEPPVQVRGGVIAALEEENVYLRGTILAKSAKDGKLYILGTEAGAEDTLTPDCILCDDVKIGATDINAAVYTAGCFDSNKCTVADGYTTTEADIDKLRERNIVFKAAYAGE